MAHILVIEDDAQFRDMLVYMLQHDGHRVDAAADGEKALTLLKEIRPDLIITDILMPNMDGVEFLLELAQQGNATPVIAMSGGRRAITSAFNLESATLMGVKASLTKPFSRADLRQVVAEVLA